jgi:hypothetical protein
VAVEVGDLPTLPFVSTKLRGRAKVKLIVLVYSTVVFIFVVTSFWV